MNTATKTRKSQPTSITIKPTYRADYGSTPERCGCPARGFDLDKNGLHAKPCKHMQLEQFRATLAQVIKNKTALLVLQGCKIKVTRDLLYSEADYRRERWMELGERIDYIVLEFVCNSIQKLEEAAGMDTSKPVLARLDRWLTDRVCGRTTLTA
jgi:hypothetical protein